MPLKKIFKKSNNSNKNELQSSCEVKVLKKLFTRIKLRKRRKEEQRSGERENA